MSIILWVYGQGEGQTPWSYWQCPLLRLALRQLRKDSWPKSGLKAARRYCDQITEVPLYQWSVPSSQRPSGRFAWHRGPLSFECMGWRYWYIVQPRWRDPSTSRQKQYYPRCRGRVRQHIGWSGRGHCGFISAPSEKDTEISQSDYTSLENWWLVSTLPDFHRAKDLSRGDPAACQRIGGKREVWDTQSVQSAFSPPR